MAKNKLKYILFLMPFFLYGCPAFTPLIFMGCNPGKLVGTFAGAGMKVGERTENKNTTYNIYDNPELAKDMQDNQIGLEKAEKRSDEITNRIGYLISAILFFACFVFMIERIVKGKSTKRILNDTKASVDYIIHKYNLPVDIKHDLKAFQSPETRSALESKK